MKRIIVILSVVLLMGCSTLRHGDNLVAPYSQEEIELSGAAAIGFGIASTFLGIYIYDQVKW